jgi:hypothetical protein
MKSLPNSTNGVIVLSDSFATSIFKQSFLRIFSKDDQGQLQMGFNATFDVQVGNTTCIYNLLPLNPAHVRPPKSSRYQVLSDTPSLLERNLHVSVKLRSASARRQPGRSMPSHLAHLQPSTSKSLPQRDSLSSKAHGALSNSSHTINTLRGSSDCASRQSRATSQRQAPQASLRRLTKRRRQC